MASMMHIAVNSRNERDGASLGSLGVKEMATVTEGYVDARADEARARTLLDVERTVSRWIRWTIMAIFASAAIIIAAFTFVVSLLVR